MRGVEVNSYSRPSGMFRIRTLPLFVTSSTDMRLLTCHSEVLLHVFPEMGCSSASISSYPMNLLLYPVCYRFSLATASEDVGSEYVSRCVRVRSVVYQALQMSSSKCIYYGNRLKLK
jgi:hypothetical protein